MITLRGITWQNPRGYDPLVAAAKAWMKDRPGVSIVWEQWPWYEFEEQIMGSLAKEGGHYDLVMFDHPWVGRLATERRLVPLQQLINGQSVRNLRARMVAPSVESYEWEDRLWAFPLDAACHAALYRTDLIDEKSLPETWEEIAPWAQAYHRPPQRYGLVLSLEGVLGNCLFLSLMASLGYPPYKDAENPVFDRTAAEYVLTTIKALIPFTPPGSTLWGPWDIFEHISQHSDVGYSPSIFAYVNYFEGKPHSAAMRLGNAPAFAGCGPARPILGGVGLGIAATCRQPQLAAAYAQFLASDAVQRVIFPASHGQPAAAAAWDDAHINRRFNGFYAALKKNMKTAYVRPRYAAFQAIELRNGEILQAWWDDKLPLKTVLDRLAVVPAQVAGV